MTPTTVASSHTRRAWLAWCSVCLIWGTTYLAIKISLDTIPPLLLGGLRYVAAGLTLAVVLRVSGRTLPAFSTWPRLALLGAIMLGVGNGGVVVGEQYLTSGLTAVVIATSPFWMVGVDSLIPGGEPFRRRDGVGLAIGFAGIVLLVWPEIAHGGATARAFALGVVSVQIACLGWAVASSYTKRHVLPADVVGAAAVQMFFGGVLMIAVGSLIGEWQHFSITLRTGLGLAYLTLAGGVIAFAAYSYALRFLPLATVSLYTYVNPVIAVALGIMLLHEPFALRQLAAAAVIFVGMAVVRRRE